MQSSDSVSEDSGDASWVGSTEQVTCPFCFGKLLFRSTKLDKCYKDHDPLWCYECGQGMKVLNFYVCRWFDGSQFVV